MNSREPVPRSDVPGVVWPAIGSDAAATVLAVQYQLDQSQWWTAERLQEAQMDQLGRLLRHAYANNTFWRKRLGEAGLNGSEPPTLQQLLALPSLGRADVQALGNALLCTDVPKDHGRVYAGETSGSTGRPVRFSGTELTQFFWRAFALREHRWHRRDFSGTLAGIRKNLTESESPSWGAVTDGVFDTGRCHAYNLGEDLDAQLDWLKRVSPTYLISTAYNVYWLARRSRDRGVRLPGLREARCYGGTFPDDARAMVRDAWNAKLVDMYTAEEVGYIALQCPENDHYHVQSENLVVEILAADGRTCAPGEIGRVVVTTLHNFAMPLFRYELGDYAEAGEACACGRGLPVIRRILGRQRNIMVLPDGTRRWPSFPSEKWSHAARVDQLQLVQKAPDLIEARVVSSRDLAASERAGLAAALKECLDFPGRITVLEVADIPRSANFKFEDFVSEIEL